MGYTPNGIKRSLTISVDKYVGGNHVAGYPHNYYGQEAGSNWGHPEYAALTDTQLQQLSDAEFTARYNDFVAYVESVENGLDFTTDVVGDGAQVADATCTTTTTVYSFAVRYGQYPVDACNGTMAVVYANTATPIVGTILYKDSTLTNPWDVTNGASMLPLSPAFNGTKSILVAIVDTVEYDLGEIMDVNNGVDCNALTPTTTQTTTAAAVFSTYYRMYKCDGSTCWLPEDVKAGYEAVHGSISTGDRFYGAEQTQDYLYTYTGLTSSFSSTPSCVINGISATTAACS